MLANKKLNLYRMRDNRRSIRLSQRRQVPIVQLVRYIVSLIVLGVLLSIFSMSSLAQEGTNNLDPGEGSSSEEIGLDMIISVMALKGGQADRALEIIDGVVAIAPDVAEAYTLRSAVQFALGDYDQCLLDGEKALDLDEEEVAAYFFMGHAAFAQENYAQARIYYTAYLNQMSDDAHQGDNALVIYLVDDNVQAMVEALLTTCDRYRKGAKQ